jgi:hypothetical protein
LGVLGGKLLQALKVNTATPKQTAHPHRSTCGMNMLCDVSGWAKPNEINLV